MKKFAAFYFLVFFSGCNFFPAGSESYYIGQSYKGGIIFYLDETQKHGLIAAPENQAEYEKWSPSSFILTGATGSNYFTGLSNTQKIISAQGAGIYAASVCQNYYGGGLSGWYLPSIDELALLFVKLKDTLTFSSGWYWSSTESDQNTAWFATENLYFSACNKNYTNKVRCIKMF